MQSRFCRFHFPTWREMKAEKKRNIAKYSSLTANYNRIIWFKRDFGWFIYDCFVWKREIKQFDLQIYRNGLKAPTNSQLLRYLNYRRMGLKASFQGFGFRLEIGFRIEMFRATGLFIKSPKLAWTLMEIVLEVLNFLGT